VVLGCAPPGNDELFPSAGEVDAVSVVLEGSRSVVLVGAAKDDSFDWPLKPLKGLADDLTPASEPKGEAVSRAKAPKPEEANALAEVCGCEAAGAGDLVPARALNGEVEEL